MLWNYSSLRGGYKAYLYNPCLYTALYEGFFNPLKVIDYIWIKLGKSRSKEERFIFQIQEKRLKKKMIHEVESLIEESITKARIAPAEN